MCKIQLLTIKQATSHINVTIGMFWYNYWITPINSALSTTSQINIFEQLLAVQCATAKTAMQLKNAIVGNHLLMTVLFRRLHSVTLRFYFKACQTKRQSN